MAPPAATARRLTAEMADAPPLRDPTPPRRAVWRAVTAFTAVVLALLAVIAWRERRETHDYWRDRLLATARHRTEAVGAWIDEHSASAALLATAPAVRQRLDPALEPEHAGEASDAGNLLRTIRDTRAAFGLDGIWLVDAEGHTELREGAEAAPADQVASLVRRTVASSAPVVGAVVLPDGRRLIGLATPLRRDKTGGPTVGSVVVFSDAATRLWPSIAGEPGDARSTESLLIERRDTDTVVLSPLLQEPNATALRRPGGAAHTALGAMDRMVEATDYRGVPVLATAHAIPGSDWSIVVKVDRREAFDRWRAELRPLVAMAGLVVLAAIGVGQALSRREQARMLTAELARQRALQAARDRSDEEILRLNTDLEQRVRDRTLALEGANRELESFNRSVSHDLRAPLRHIEGFLRIVMEDHGAEIPAPARGHLERVQAACVRMEALIDALLALSRVGRHELQRRPVDLAALARAAFAELEPAIGARRIELAVGPMPTVSGDPVLLRELFDNLLANAAKFTRPREVAHLEVGEQLVDGAPAFYVRDDGVGFDPAYAHKLFGAFERLHGSDEFEGSGLGLSIVKRIVDKHGGRVWAAGAPDHGATVFFTLGSQTDA